MRALWAGFLTFAAVWVPLARAEPFELRAGDRVVLVGDALIEREQRYGYLETALLTRFPQAKVQFRNLGWSGDTVDGLARSYFDPPSEGTKRLLEQVRQAKPTVLVIGYGMAESFAGPAGVPDFRRRLESLLDHIAPGVRTVVLLSPIRHELLPPPLPDPAVHNQSLEQYAAAIGAVAQNRHYQFVDLFHSRQMRAPPHLTDDSIHLTAAGYWQLSEAVFAALGLAAPERRSETPDALRQAVIRKNRLYFLRYRPQNITYLLGFRSYEQGQNAKEISELDRLIADAEQSIEQLRPQ